MVLSSQPPKRVPFGCIIGAAIVVPGLLEDADTPRTGDQNLGSAVAVVVRAGAEPVVAGVEQPAAEARAVGLPSSAR